MSRQATEALVTKFGEGVIAVSDRFGDDEAVVKASIWKEAAAFLKASCAMDHYIDLTAVDYPERAARFDVILFVRSNKTGKRVRLKTHLNDGQKLQTLSGVWRGANWSEREVFDMFGIHFEGHPDQRRILMYEEFNGHPLRKDYPITGAQPLVPYREVEDNVVLPPFGPFIGQPFGRGNPTEAGEAWQVSPAIGNATGERPNVSQGPEYTASKTNSVLKAEAEKAGGA